MKMPKLTAKRRVWLYGVAGTGLGAAAVAKWIDPTLIPAWMLFVGAVLGVGGNATAAVKVAQQRRNGTLE